MMRRWMTLFLALAMVLSMSVSLAGCGKDDEPPATASGVAGTYTVTVESAGGMPLEGVAVSVYADDTLTDMKGYL